MKKIIVWLGIIAILVFGISTFKSDSVNIHNETLSQNFLMKKIPIINI